MLTRQMVGIVVNCSPREIVNGQIGAISKGTTPKFKRGHLRNFGWKGANTPNYRRPGAVPSLISGPPARGAGPCLPPARFYFARKPWMRPCMPIAAAVASASPPVRFRVRGGPRPGRSADAMEARRIEAAAERMARACDAAARVDRLLEALEAIPAAHDRALTSSWFCAIGCERCSSRRRSSRLEKAALRPEPFGS
jgi:hypothetical protein